MTSDMYCYILTVSGRGIGHRFRQMHLFRCIFDSPYQNVTCIWLLNWPSIHLHLASRRKANNENVTAVVLNG
jgi:hypothetical protein